MVIQHTQDFQNVVKTCRARFLTLIGSMRGHESTLENPFNDSLMPALGIAFGWEGQLKNQKLKSTWYVELLSKRFFSGYFFAFLI